MGTQSKYQLDKEAEDNVLLPIQAEMYRHDLLRFLEEQYYLPTGKLIVLEKWQRRVLTKAFTVKKKTGKRRYDTILLMTHKKSGKSTLAAGVALWALFFDDPNPEVFLCSGDIDQSHIIFRKVTTALRFNKALHSQVDITSSLIELKNQKGFLRNISSDAPTAHGHNASCVIYDELWQAQSEDLFTAMSLPPSRANPFMMIVTYTGFDKTSLLYRLWEAGVNKTDKSMFFFWSNKILASWVSKEFLERQKKLLSPNEYLRLYETRWTESEEQFISIEELNQCIDNLLTPKIKGLPKYAYFLGVDLGLKHDKAVCTTTHYDYEKEEVVLDEVESWQGSKESPVELAGIEDYIYDCWQRYHHNKIVVDPWQAASTIQKFSNRGLPIEEFPFSMPNVSKIASNLYFLFHNRRIRIFPYKPLIDELKTCHLTAKSYGYKISHKSGKHDDFVISLALAALFSSLTHRPKAAPEVWIIKSDPDDD